MGLALRTSRFASAASEAPLEAALRTLRCPPENFANSTSTEKASEEYQTSPEEFHTAAEEFHTAAEEFHTAPEETEISIARTAAGLRT